MWPWRWCCRTRFQLRVESSAAEAKLVLYEFCLCFGRNRKVKAARGERNSTSCFQIRRDFLLSPDSIGIKCGLCILNVTAHHVRGKKEETLTKTKASTRSRYSQLSLDNRWLALKIAASTQQQRILYSTGKKKLVSPCSTNLAAVRKCLIQTNT